MEHADDVLTQPDLDRDPATFEIATTVRDGVHTVGVFGDLDLASTPQLFELLRSLPEDAAVRLDLSGVPFIDSAGLKALLTAQQRFGDQLTLPQTPEHIVKLLTLVGIKKRLRFEP